MTYRTLIRPGIINVASLPLDLVLILFVGPTVALARFLPEPRPKSHECYESIRHLPGDWLTGAFQVLLLAYSQRHQ